MAERCACELSANGYRSFCIKEAEWASGCGTGGLGGANGAGVELNLDVEFVLNLSVDFDPTCRLGSGSVVQSAWEPVFNALNGRRNCRNK